MQTSLSESLMSTKATLMIASLRLSEYGLIDCRPTEQKTTNLTFLPSHLYLHRAQKSSLIHLPGFPKAKMVTAMLNNRKRRQERKE